MAFNYIFIFNYISSYHYYYCPLTYDPLVSVANEFLSFRACTHLLIHQIIHVPSLPLNKQTELTVLVILHSN